MECNNIRRGGRMAHSAVDIHIIEPDDMFRRVLLRTLADVGREVHSYADGYEFMEGYKGEAGISIFVINDILPKKSGMEVVDHIRSQDGRSVIYFMTRSNTEEEMVYALNSGVDGYFIKPFNLKVFQAKIKRLILRGNRVWI